MGEIFTLQLVYLRVAFRNWYLLLVIVYCIRLISLTGFRLYLKPDGKRNSIPIFKPERFTVLRLTNAYLVKPDGDEEEETIVQLVHDEETFGLCCLNKNRRDVSLDVVIPGDGRTQIKSVGNSEIHVIGYYSPEAVPYVDSDVEMSDDAIAAAIEKFVVNEMRNI